MKDEEHQSDKQPDVIEAKSVTTSVLRENLGEPLVAETSIFPQTDQILVPVDKVETAQVETLSL